MNDYENDHPTFRGFLSQIATESVNGSSGEWQEPRRCPTCESLDHRECDPEILREEDEALARAIEGERRLRKIELDLEDAIPGMPEPDKWED